jgi:hypothetical protein
VQYVIELIIINLIPKVSTDDSPQNENLNLLVQIKFLNLLHTCNIYLNKNWKFTGPNKVLLVLGRRTGAHREDMIYLHTFFVHCTISYINNSWKWINCMIDCCINIKWAIIFRLYIVWLIVVSTSSEQLYSDCILYDWLLYQHQVSSYIQTVYSRLIVVSTSSEQLYSDCIF